MSDPNSAAPSVRDLAVKAKATTPLLRLATEGQREQGILAIEKALFKYEAEILAANAEDVQDGEAHGLSSALLDRLRLNPARLAGLRDSLRSIAAATPVLGQIEDRHVRPDGLEIARQRMALGVIGVIFESRPNVLIDCAALAIKSGNAILLKGGSDAARSNRILGTIVQEAITPHLPRDCVQIIPSGDRQLTLEMVKLDGLLDLIIPRGGEGLIRMVIEHARVPVISHAKGLCHLYLHKDADPAQATAITMNAKTQRPGVCNALETLLVHESLVKGFLPDLLDRLQKAGVELRADSELCRLLPERNMGSAKESDWDTEYLDMILSVKLVKNLEEAIEHIQRYGSHHTEAIVARDPEAIRIFSTVVDASCIAVNASTRFNDGGELGLGAEIGISTSKLHAYGPMGAKELTCTRFVVQGTGHCRG